MKKKLFRITGLILCLLLTLSILNCGGGGGGGSDNGGGTTTTDDGITIPVGGSSGTVTLTGGTNKYGFQKIWKTGITSYPSIETFFNICDVGSDIELCLYFSDNNIYFFAKMDSVWYLVSCYSYTYNSGDNTFTATGSNTINNDDGLRLTWGKIVIDGDTARILSIMDNSYNFYHCQKQDSFSETVTTADDDIVASWDDVIIDNSLALPTITSLSASYSGGDVTATYDITAPTGKNINFIRFTYISSTVYDNREKGDFFLQEAFPINGQVIYHEFSLTAANHVNGNNTKTLTNPENGAWYISEIRIECDDGTEYNLILRVDENWFTTYYYENDDGEDDVYKNTGIAVKTFTVSGSTADTTPPTLSSVSVSGTTVTVTADSNLTGAEIYYMTDNMAEDDEREDRWATTISGTTATFDCSGADAGTYYIALIALRDASGNWSTYFGYDTDVSFWNGDFTPFGLDFSKYNRFRAGEQLPAVTTIGLKSFTKP